MQSCAYYGTKPRPDIQRYCTIKVLEYRLWIVDPNNREKDIIIVVDFEVVKTAEVRDYKYLKVS